MASATATVATRLGWAGLVPFVVAPLALQMSEQSAALVASAISAYGLAILCFLVGSWWGIALLRRYPQVLMASNIVVVAACLGFVFLELPAQLTFEAFLFLGLVGRIPKCRQC